MRRRRILDATIVTRRHLAPGGQRVIELAEDLFVPAIASLIKILHGLAREQMQVAARQPLEEAPDLRLGHVGRPARQQLGHVGLIVLDALVAVTDRQAVVGVDVQPPEQLLLPRGERLEADRFDVGQRVLEVEISDEALRQRMKEWKPPLPRYPAGVFAKYAALVSSASQGAITRPPK